LIGNVSLRYNFNGSTNVYTDTVTFTTADLSNGGLSKIGVSGLSSKAMVCIYHGETSPFAGYRYNCAITRIVNNPTASGADVFWFNITNGVISGRYNYCTGSLVGSSCVTNIALGADGPVTGTVTSAQSRQSAQSFPVLTSNDESKATEKSLQRDVERPLSAKQQQLAEQIRQSLQMLNR
jgi:hypothetical protein